MTRTRRLAGWANLAAASVLMLAVWVLLVLLASRPAFKHLFDFSPQATGSISPVTEELLAEIRRQDIQVEIHTFLPPLGSPPQNNEEARHRWEIVNRLHNLTYDLLRQYGYFGGEAVRVVHHDLMRDVAKTREAAERFRFRGDEGSTVVVVVEGRHEKLQLESDMAVIEFPAMGPQANVPGPRSTLPLLKDYKGEEAISSAIKALLTQGTPVVYFLKGFHGASLDDTTGGGYSKLAQGLKDEGFEIRELSLRETREVPQDAAVVALLEPRAEITDRDAQALYEYVRRGGRLFVNFSFVPIQGMNPTLGELGRRLGFDVSPEVVFHLIPTSTPSAPWDDGKPEVRQLDVQSMAPNHPITKPLILAGRAPQFTMARELRRRDDVPEGVRPDPSLLTTGPHAWLANWPEGGRPDLYHAPRDPRAFQARSLSMVIDVDSEEEGTEGHVVLLGGMAINNVGYPINYDLGLNVFNWLAERKALVTIRGKDYRASRLQVGAEELSNMKWLLVAGWPGGLLLLGLLVLWRRRRI